MFLKRRNTWSFYVVVLQSFAGIEMLKDYKAREQLLFFSINLLFGNVLVAVLVVVCLSPV